MRRREVIAGLGGAVATSLVAQAQERVRRVGVLMNTAADHPEGKFRLAIFQQALQDLGWIGGQNIRFETRGAVGIADNYRKYAAELIALSPDVVLALTTTSVIELQRVSRTLPIVFTQVIDPVGSGLVASMARPSENATGFTTFEYAISAKWLELLKEVAPGVTRIAVLRTSATAAGIGQFAAVQTVAPVQMELSAIGTNDAAQVERGIDAFARDPNGGLIVTASGFAANYPGLIATLAARNNLPAVYPFRYFVTAGGLISYGPMKASNTGWQHAMSIASSKVKNRLPCRCKRPPSTSWRSTSRPPRLSASRVPPSLLARADEVIE